MNINEWLGRLAHDYVLIIIAAVLFFAAKAFTGYITYRHYDRKISKLDKKLEELLRLQKR